MKIIKQASTIHFHSNSLSYILIILSKLTHWHGIRSNRISFCNATNRL